MNHRPWNHRACHRATLALFVSLLMGCSVGPRYERPALVTPATFRGAEPPDAEPPDAAPVSTASLADQHWWELFADPTLRSLIHTALEQSYDLAIASARVLEAEAQLGIAAADRLPTLNAQLTAQTTEAVSGGAAVATGRSLSAGVSASWELDFWGKFRRADEAARAQILASEWGRRASVVSLISQVASAYFNLRALDRQHDIAEQSLAARRQALELIEWRERSGAGSLLDVRQAEELVHLAAGDRADIARQIAQQENLISTLLGRDPGEIGRGLALDAQRLLPELPAGLPSSLLERRPDIQVAEQELIALNAQIGVAQADYFPQLTLTGGGGIVSSTLLAFFSSPAVIASAAANLVQPLFDGGRTSSAVRAAEARREQALLAYRRTIVQALREVSDSLVGFRQSRELRVTREALLRATREARQLAELRYQGGTSSYLEVLDGDTRLYDAEFALVQAQLSELLGYVELYRALGGGWQAADG
jgi:multidrug efflux system outer membrane protein